ncbi:hypothetical protein HTZ77_19600 [Nonomuraea sp. SMC257]|uniref:Uncharacterized protein n=1 Tax=Nonomuraea montanisoli TaxID=2741721 RepID=A0A7Y6I913_9ACTN|nr:DUF6082 family protein [Nonomuraea montanisoli]NUW33621.1 hypothetical protein [Nonomuraea montanisoli]
MSPRFGHDRSRLVVALVTAFSIGCVIAATMSSPLLLQALLPVGYRWQELSDIGQAYGVASAILSALALAVVGLSFFLQAKEANYARHTAQRTHHLNLMQLQMEHPELHNALGGMASGLNPRLHLYLNLILSYWEMLYEVGEMSGPVLLEYARADFFGTPAGRIFWENTREHRRAVAQTRRAARFVSLIDRAWEMAGPTESEQTPIPARTPSRQARRAMAVAAALATGAAAAVLLRALRSQTGT